MDTNISEESAVSIFIIEEKNTLYREKESGKFLRNFGTLIIIIIIKQELN
jgi:hypothetical protein